MSAIQARPAPATTGPRRALDPGGALVSSDLVILLRDTVRVLGRLFPQVLAVWLLGWLGRNLALQVAVEVGDVSGWAALVVFSFSFLSTLVAVVVILRICGQELGIRQLIPESEGVADDRDTSLTRLLAVTLLPFLGLYAAFGQVGEQAAKLSTQQVFRNSVFGPKSVLATVQDLAVSHPWRLLALLVAVYVLRRVVDAAHEKTGWRPLGLVVALIESFFILAVIFGGFRLGQRVTSWLETREYQAWIAGLGRGIHRVLAAIHLQLPAALDRLLAFVSDTLVPLLVTVVGQPIVWLAVAALVYGSRVLSLAELWRRGRPLTKRIPGASVFDRRAERRRLVAAPPPGIRRLGNEVREAFLGDIDDKYLPTFHSLRLVLRAGPGFLGAYVLVYNALLIATNYVVVLYQTLLGGRDVDFWYVGAPVFDLVESIPWELLRLCLLAVAFRRCLELFQQRGRAAA